MSEQRCQAGFVGAEWEEKNDVRGRLSRAKWTWERCHCRGHHYPSYQEARCHYHPRGQAGETCGWAVDY